MAQQKQKSSMDKDKKRKLLKELQHYYNIKLANDSSSKFEVNQVFENLLQLLDTFES